MKIKRWLTSLLVSCILLSSFLCVPASAEFTSQDSTYLKNIYSYIQYFTFSASSWGRNSLLGFLDRILERIPTNLSTNFQLLGGEGTNSLLKSNRDYVQNLYNYIAGDNIKGNLNKIQQNTLASADRLLNTNTLLSSLSSDNSQLVSLVSSIYDTVGYAYGTTISNHLFSISTSLSIFADDSLMFTDEAGNNFYTPYHYIRQLAETLASDDDRQLAENYKENREQAEQDFLSGQSGKTSLGKDDFSNVSDVGGTLNDTFNMGGTSKVSDFVSGFGSAGTESQSWFSQTTANNLDGVTSSGNSTSGVSTFADDGVTMIHVDPDPYNMAEIAERYSWLEEAVE